MTGCRFENTTHALRHTNKEPPSYEDKFWEIRDLIEAWNKNMCKNFMPSWVSCLDGSMSHWTSKCTCSGFVFVPKKTFAQGNEHHTVACGESGMF